MFGIFLLVLVAILISGGIWFVLNQRTLGLVTGAFVFVIGIIFQSFTVISAGHTGVQVTLGEVNLQALTEGVHFVNPISSVKGVDVRLQRANLNGASAGTKDLQQVHTDIVINYRLTANKVPHIYKEFGRFRKESGIKGDDKWNPADIWMAKRTFKLEKDWPTLKEYNTYIYEQYKKKNLVGISLKKLAPKGKATPKIYNDGKKRKSIKKYQPNYCQNNK